jgi:hypothetical protein
MATWKKVIVSGSSPELASVTLDTELAIDYGGTGGTTQGTAQTALGVGPIAGNVNLTTVGTIGAGTWSGTKVASAYLDDDTAHLTTTQTFTGAKTFQSTLNAAGISATHVTASGNVSASLASSASFGRVDATTLYGDGSGLTNLTAAAISTYTNAQDHRVITSTDASSVDAEALLTFNPTTEILAGPSASFDVVLGDGSGLTGVVTDLDALSNSVTSPTTDDLLLISDGTEEKKMTWASATASMYAGVTGGDVTIAADGAASIGATKVTNAMLAGSIANANLLQITTANKIDIGAIDIDGGTAMVALADADLMIIDDGAVGTNRKITADAVPTYVFSKVGSGATIASNGDFALADNSVTTGNITNDHVTYAKMQDIATANRVLGVASVAGEVAEVQIATGMIANDAVTTEKIDEDAVKPSNLHSDVAGTGLSLDSSEGLSINWTDNGVTTATPQFLNLTITGDLTVQGTTTTLDTQNLLVEDNFIFAATGSAAANVDAGLIVQNGAVDQSGSAIYHETLQQRWSVAKGLGASAGSGSGAAAIQRAGYVTTVQTDQSTAPGADSGSYGEGEMWITAAEDIWIRTG